MYMLDNTPTNFTFPNGTTKSVYRISPNTDEFIKRAKIFLGGMIIEAIVFILSIGWVIGVHKKSKRYKKSIE